MHTVKKRRWHEPQEGTLLITGDGKTLPDDLARFLATKIDHEVLCIGRSIKLYPGEVTHYADVDADAGKWVCENLVKNHPGKGNPITHTLGDVPWFDVGWDLDECLIHSDDILWHGSTSLFAVLVGLAMGYDQIILAGCPLDSKGHWYDEAEQYGPRWTFESYQSWLEFAMTEDCQKVTSMSGYTAIMVGKFNHKIEYACMMTDAPGWK